MRRPIQGPSLLKFKKRDQWLRKYYCLLERIWANRGVSEQMWFVPKEVGDGGWQQCNPRKPLQLLPSFELGNSVSTTLLHNEYRPPLPITYTHLKDDPHNLARWKQGNLKIPILCAYLRKADHVCPMNKNGHFLVNLGQFNDKISRNIMQLQRFWSLKISSKIQKGHCVPSMLIFKNPNFQSLGELGKARKYNLWPTFKNHDFEFMDELGVMP